MDNSTLPASLACLPQELMDNITKYLTCQDIYRLTRTCKSIHKDTIKALYTNITLNWIVEPEMGSSPDELVSCAVLKGPRYARLIYNVLHYRELASEIKKVEITTSDLAIYGKYVLPSISPEDRVLLFQKTEFSDALLRAESTGYLWWKYDFDTSISFRSLIAILIYLCPNVEVLHIDMLFALDNVILQDILTPSPYEDGGDVSQKPKPVFQKLRELRIGEENSKARTLWNRPGLPLHLYIESQQYPSLETLGVHCAYYQGQFDMNAARVSKFDKLTTLCLRRSNIRPESLANVLLRFPCLTTLYYDRLHTYMEVKFDCEVLQVALDKMKDQLIHLFLHIHMVSLGQRAHGYFLCAEYEGRCSLKSYPCLTTVQAPLPLLAGHHDTCNNVQDWERQMQDYVSPFWDSLPSQIERLIINHDCTDVVEESLQGQLSSWLDFLRCVFAHSDWRGLVPRLQKLDFKLLEQPMDTSKYDTIRQLCSENGLNCTITKIFTGA